MSIGNSNRYYLGLDVGRTIRGAIIGTDGAIIKQARVVSEVSNPRLFIDQLIDIINGLCAAEEACNQVTGVGIGWAGLINRSTQRVEANPNLVDVSSFDIHSELEAATRLPIIIDNDANMAAYGEWLPLGFACMQEVLKRDYRLKSIVVKNFDETRAKRDQKQLWRYRALAGGFYVFKHEYVLLCQKK